MTKHDIQDIANCFSTKIEFKNKAQYAYAQAGKMGIRDEVCAHMGNGRVKWTKDTLAIEAKKYASKAEFAEKSGGAYNKARKLKIVDEICSHMEVLNIMWTKDMIQEVALKYEYKARFMEHDKNAYMAAQRAGVIDEVCAHMTPLNITWTPELLAEEALKYKTRSEFKRAHNNAYKKALGFGIINDICKHMTKVTTLSDNDSIYIWKVVGMHNIYKVSTTSARLGEKRMVDTMRHSGFEGDIVLQVKIGGRATDVEDAIHDKFEVADIGSGFEGHTEFRVMNKKELREAITMITSLGI